MITENSIFACVLDDDLWVGRIEKYNNGYYINWNNTENDDPKPSVTLEQIEKNFKDYSSHYNGNGSILNSEQELLAFKLKMKV
jgi:hypothetical protein